MTLIDWICLVGFAVVAALVMSLGKTLDAILEELRYANRDRRDRDRL